MKLIELAFADLYALMTQLSDIGDEETAMLVAQEIDRRVENIDFSIEVSAVPSPQEAVTVTGVLEMIDEEEKLIMNIHGKDSDYALGRMDTIDSLRSRIGKTE